MRIAIDLTTVRSTGTKVYSSGLMPALGRLAGEDEFLVFLSPDIADLLAAQLPGNFQLRITTVTSKVVRRIVWEQAVMPQYLLTWQADVLFAPYDISPLVSPCPVLLAVRNPSSALLARGSWSARPIAEQAKAHMHRLLSYLSCRRARLVLYPSAYAARLLGDLLMVPPDKRTFVHHGIDYDFWSAEQESASVLSQYHISRQRFVLFVSEFYFYKHPEVLIEGFARWRGKTDNTGYKLVLVGKIPDIDYEKNLHQQVDDLGLENEILFLGHVPRSHLAVLYQQAAAFVLPTVMETFGFPFVEAMASGTPVICADTEFARELCGETALYFPAGDSHALSQMLEKVIEEPMVEAYMRETGRCRAKQFSWECEAQQTLGLLKKVGNSVASTWK